jgi:hypothetical protein
MLPAGELSRCAWETVRKLYRAGLEDRHAVAGMVVSIQTYGDLANWQPHLHALVSAGVFHRQGEFTSLTLPPAGVAEELFRRQWARLIAKVFEVDPLGCPCGATMRVVAFILDPAVIRKILQHRLRPEPRAHAPPPG